MKQLKTGAPILLVAALAYSGCLEPEGECPLERPRANACDVEGLECMYLAPGCEPDSGLEETLTCEDGVWHTDGLHCDPIWPSEDCPVEHPEYGGLCSDEGMACLYTAPNCEPGSGADETMWCEDGVWQTDGVHCEPPWWGDCPPERPEYSGPCDDEGLECLYPAPGCRADTDVFETMWCEDGLWQADGTHCEPAVWESCPEEHPDYGAPCEEGVRECLYVAPGCDADWDIWETMWCEDGLWRSDGMHCDPEE